MADYNEVLDGGSISKVVTETQLVKSGQGVLRGILTTATSSGTLQVIDGTEASVAATTTLTSTGACVPAVHGQSVLTSSGAMVPGSHATSVLTADAVVDGNVVVIGSITYTAKNVPTLPYHVAIGGSTQTFLANLKAVINGNYTPVQGYGGASAHPQVVATASDATTLTVWGRVAGTSLNTVATTGTALRTVWADTTLGGGTGASDAGVTTAGATVTIDTTVYTVVVELSETLGATAVPYEVLYGGTEAAMLDNLKLAINATAASEGTKFGTGTVAHPSFRATTNTDTAQTIIAREVGDDTFTAAINAMVTEETMANTAWTGADITNGTQAQVTNEGALLTIGSRTYTAVTELDETSGADATADQILWVTSEAVFLDNIKKAINSTGIAGTDYSTGTTQHADVVATTNAADSQVFAARLLGAQGNEIATDTTLANYSFTSTVMGSGAGAEGELIIDTYTPAAAANANLFNRRFERGLFVTVGGTSISSSFFYR